jgi:hypothetical protein
MEFFKLPHHKSNINSWFPFFVYVLNKLYTFSMPNIYFLLLVAHEPFYIFGVHLVDGQLDLSAAAVCVALVAVLLMSRPVIHFLRYLPCLLSCGSHFINAARTKSVKA